MTTLYWSRCRSPWGTLRLLATEQGLCLIVLPGRGGVDRWIERHLQQAMLVEGHAILRRAALQLAEYFAQQRQTFELPLDLRGTPFQRAVWEVLRTIPYGERWSYRQVAAALGRPQAVRAVGRAVGANPLPIVIPCHRVVRADGSLGGYGGGSALKRALLSLERGPQEP